MSWGAENALTVGAVTAALFIGGLGFLLVLARARAEASRGWYR